ncbi:cytochrome c peroxidase [Pleionea sp. CnH1-48]|uniref:cytochrome c peroxidase n=1 Tax=Pleionea sp. CnH1-48 TaxID=2954494 RepID=UPI00209759B1|nr:cytochrome c peroxidase [Pleionea sp. CnH1-48]MCO7224841.1 Ig-like domain-containing protein [Pleionea sp. CnH1-48]
MQTSVPQKHLRFRVSNTFLAICSATLLTACSGGGSDDSGNSGESGSTNTLPVATSTSFSIDENSSLNANVTATDADGDALTFNVTDSTNNGSLTLNANGSFIYTPTVNFNGQDQFSFVANDGTGNSNNATVTITVNDVVVTSPLDNELSSLISQHNLTGDASTNRVLPNISDPIPQLGMKLFFSKSLGGDQDSACVTCHHPALGGADDLSLPVGVHAAQPDLLGVGRETENGELPPVPRNAPTVFNTALWDSSLFHDSRVESIGKEDDANGSLSPIRTPDSNFGTADANAGANLAAAQARFPVTSAEEMKGTTFEANSDNQTIRAHLAARIGNYGVGAGELATNNWLTEFQTAFASGDSAENLITFDNIAMALGEYERSMVLVNNPWKRYVGGELNALTDEQKEGAILFYTSVDNGGAGCVNCHSGDFFTDEQHHTIAFPQIGAGKGDGNDDDFGRERETGDNRDRYRFRTPTLLNIAVTAPYGHAGAYETLTDVVRHYVNPRGRVDDYFDDNETCDLPQFDSINNCNVNNLYPNAENNTNLALNKLQQERNAGTSLFDSPRLNQQETQQLVAFLNALTDPCVNDRSCIGQWIPDTSSDGPDNNQLNAVDANGNLL